MQRAFGSISKQRDETTSRRVPFPICFSHTSSEFLSRRCIFVLAIRNNSPAVVVVVVVPPTFVAHLSSSSSAECGVCFVAGSMKRFLHVFRWIALCSMLLFVFFSVQTVSSASLKGDHQSLTAQSLNGVHSVAPPEGGDKVTTRSATTSTTTTQPRNKSLSRRARIHYRIG